MNLGGLRALRAGLGLMLGLLGATAWAQPTNDFFTNAIVLTNITGVIHGTNGYATLETGEVPVLGLGEMSVWYSWTAPVSGRFRFATRGSDFDTMLGVYTGTNVADLAIIGENDDVNFPVDASSVVEFDATAGITYDISVAAFPGLTNVGGNITLSWRPATFGGYAGEFSFTSDIYSVSERESSAPLSVVMGGLPARAVITRSGGTAGRVIVDYVVTNSMYFNRYETNVFGTNVLQNGTVLAGYTNVIVYVEQQNMENGQLTYLPRSIFDVYRITFENNALLFETNLNAAARGNIVSNYYCDNATIATGTGPNGEAMETNVFCLDPQQGEAAVPAAIAGVDFAPRVGSVVFDDFQMSTNILVTVMANNPQPVIYNRVVEVLITGVTLDPLESPDLQPPDILRNSALINIHDIDVVPRTGQRGTNIFNFERATLRCTEGVGTARVGVLRSTLDPSQATSVQYRIDYNQANETPNDLNTFAVQAGSDYATPDGATAYSENIDFTSVTGTLNWGAYDTQPKFIDIPIFDDNLVEFNEDFLVQLFFPDPQPTDRFLGYVRNCNVTILFDNAYGGEQPAGAMDRTYNRDGDSGTTPPYNMHPGANSTVYAVAVQSDGRAVIAGDFTSYNATPRNRIARVNVNGQLDTSFDPAEGADQFVTCMTIESSAEASGKILIGGAFTSINRVPRLGLARLDINGSLDNSFDPGLGANGTVWQIATPTNGVLVAGEFTQFNGTNRNGIARLARDGSLDTSFDPGIGPNGPVYAMVAQPDGRVLIGGSFSSVSGVPRSCIARLNVDGSLDTTFDPRSGAAGTAPAVYSLALQPDGRIVAGGSFGAMYGLPRNNIARLLPTGALDESFDPGSGTDDVVYDVSVLSNGNILLAGVFTSFNQTRRVGLARLLPYGVVDTSFMDTAYNQFAGVPNHYYNPDIEPHNFIFKTAVQSDGNIIIGGGFMRVGGGFTRDDIRERRNVARIIGNSTPGPGSIELAASTYTADSYSGQIFVTMMRTNGHLGAASASVEAVPLEPGPGAAVPGEDYSFPGAIPTWPTSWNKPTWQIQDGTFGQNQGISEAIGNNGLNTAANDVWVTILPSATPGNKQLNLQVTRPGRENSFALGGDTIPLGVALGRTRSSLSILDSYRSHGALGFAVTNFLTYESSNAVVTVTRTGGSEGLVNVYAATMDGTATNGIHYTSVTNVLLTFGQGVTNQNLVIPIINDAFVQYDHTVNLKLYTPGGGAVLGISNAVLTIVDNDVAGGYLQFSAPQYYTNENAGFALITVTRNGSSSGTLAVTMSTTNGTALSGANYSGLTTNLTWLSTDIRPKVIAIPISADGIEEPTNFLNFSVLLSNPKRNGLPNPATLGTVSNAVVTLINTDFHGSVAFATVTNRVAENGGPATITVVRTGGSAEAISVNYSVTDLSAYNGVHYTASSGSLLFGVGELSKTITVPVIDNSYQDPALARRYATLNLFGASPASGLGFPSTALLEIVDDESVAEPPGTVDTTEDPLLGFNGTVHSLALQPDGRLLVGGDFTEANTVARNRIARIEPGGSLDATFLSAQATAGANDSVLAIVAQTDQRVLIGGKFTVVNGLNRNFLARLNLNGSTDSTFNPGSGPDNSVFSLVETFVGGERKLLLGGAFNTFNSLSSPCVARLNDNGSLDAAFTVGAGANGTVFAVAVQGDGRILIGGDFTAYNNIARSHIARLNADGSLDMTFDPAGGPNASVRAIAIQPDGNILIGGLFTAVRGQPLNRVARLLPNATLDSAFNPGSGADDIVSTITLQPDTRIILGGQFSRFNGVTRNRLTRLNADGSVDTMINFGTGANSFVAATLVQADSRIVIGGGFTEFNGQPVAHFARLYGLAIGGSGTLEFTQPVYEIGESQGSALVTVIRRGGTSASSGGANATITLATAGGSAVLGSNYVAVVTNLVFPPGEVLQSALIPVRRDYAITPDLTVNLVLSNVAPAVADGPAPGNLMEAELSILNEDSSASFSSASYSRNESGQIAVIPVVRSGSTRGYTSVDFITTTNGTAVADVNYTPVTNTLVFGPGATNVLARVPVLYSPLSQGTLTVGLELTNAVNCLLFNPFTAVLNILDVDNLPGDITFAYTNHVVNEGDGVAYIPVLRTNGSSGTISVNYFTVSNTALPGLNYVSTNGILSFADGETSKVIAVPLIDNTTAQDEFTTLFVALTNATAGATILEPTNTLVTIRDNDQAVKFLSYIYPVQESAGSVTLSVFRVGTNGPTTVWYTTTNGTAMAGTNYQSASNHLDFVAGESLKTFNISLLRDTNVTGDLSFGVRLFNPSAPAQLAQPSLTTVVLFDQDPGLAFTNAIFGTLKSSNSVVLTVVRSNANTGTVTVNYSTANDTAQAGIDYVATSGQLVFSNGVAFQSFTVPLISNRLVEGDRTFKVNLFSPSAGAQLLAPSQASVFITNDVSGLAFSAPEYSVSEAGVAASINVVRSGYLDGTVSIDYVTADGTAKAGANYLPAAGTLIFTNGETAKTFLVPVIDNSVVEGDKTVLLRLLNPGGNSSLLSPNAATLTIIEADGSLILPAGTAITYESGPVNGIVDTNETVTMLFGLRNGAGTNTANVVATLLQTNGVLNPSGPLSYGVLPVRGPSTSRPFTFSVNGTNGQPISATFALTNGASVSYVAFNFTLGRVPSVWSNSAPIFINDHTNASPYPSTITVSGLGGAVVQATVTLTNLKHSAPGDISMLLVSPTDARTVLMAKTGARNALVDGVTLTFDDTATASLPQSATITSGTYRPTSYAIAPPPFPVPAPPVPYPTNLSVMNGSNPNGTWSLFVIDDTWLDTGVVSNGWVLKLITQGAAPASSDVGVTMTATPSAVVVSNNLTYTLRVTNYGPATATGVVVTNYLPAGVAYVSSSPAASTNAAGEVIWSVGTLAKDGFATLTLVVRPDTAGVIVNRAAVGAASGDPNPDDDTATLSTTVVLPTANLAIGVGGLPNPIWLGETVTYSVYVTNLGPAAAPVLAVTNMLPAGFTLVSATAGYIPLTGNRVAFPNLGTLGATLTTSVSITARPTAAGIFTNFATCASSITDTNKANNTGSAKTEVLSFRLAMASSGGQLTLAWTNIPNSVLVASTNLSLPLQSWTEVTSPPTTVVNGIKTVTLPVGSGTSFYAVRLPRP